MVDGSSLRIHVGYERDDDWRTLESMVPPDVTITWGPEPPPEAGYRVLVAGVPSDALLRASPALDTLIIPWAGLPRTTAKALRAHPGIAVHNLHFNAGPTAEMVVALLLAVARRLVLADQALRRGDWSWRGRMADGRELAGRTAVVLGYGAIGARVGRALQGLGLDVIAVTRSGTASRSSGVSGATPHRVVAAAELDAVLPEADVLAITVPATERTRGRIDAAALARLPANAILVNVARGSVVDEAALFEALRTGRLFGAGLDVWYRYPSADEEPGTATLPGRLPFHELESVVLSPHRGGHVDDTERTRMIALARLVELARAGHPLPDRVDLVAGY